jgi:hypothetical protein
MKTAYAVLLSLLIPVAAAAQDAVSAAGGDAGGVSWTLGEVVTETYATTALVVIQGFNQPEAGVVTGIDHVAARRLAVDVYPNPVVGLLHIAGADGETYRWQLSALDGKSLDSGQASTVDFTPRPAGTYLLRIGDGKREQSFIVIKK